MADIAAPQYSPGDSPTETSLHLRFDDNGLLVPSKSRKNAKSNINGLCDKPLDKLPVSKDLPRLARKIEVFLPTDDENQTDSSGEESDLIPHIHRIQSFKEYTDWKDITAHTFVPDPEDDPKEIPKHIILYQLLQALATNLPNRDSNKPFPTYEQYVENVNLDDPNTLNQFLLDQFGERHDVIRLLKVCHQSVILNVLLGARNALSKHHIQFKDVRGAWRIQVHLPRNSDASPRERNTSNSTQIASSVSSTTTSNIIHTPRTASFDADPFLLDLERLKSRYISLAHRRREQVFIPYIEWKKQVEEATGKILPTAKGALKQLFQFEWEVRVFFDQETLEMQDVTVQLLGMSHENEDGSHTEEHECEKQKKLLTDYFMQYVVSDSMDDVVTPSSLVPTPKATGDVANEETSLVTGRKRDGNAPALGIRGFFASIFCWMRRSRPKNVIS